MQGKVYSPKLCLLPSMSFRSRWVYGIVFFVVFFYLFFPERQVGAAGLGSFPPPPIVREKVEKILTGRAFKSHEELLQLCYLLYKDESKRGFSLNKEELARLDDEITTLFPLGECNSIELWGPYIILQFSGPQDVSIPHTWFQASMQVPQKLILQIQEEQPNPDDAAQSPFAEDPATRTVTFTVKEGYVRVHFSFLLKLFGGRLRDAEGSKLVYQINNKKKISRLQLDEVTPMPKDSFRLAGVTMDKEMGRTQWVDIVHPDFPERRDIGIAKNAISFLGTKVELLPDKMIRIGNQKPRENEKAWDWFSENIAKFRMFVTKGALSGKIKYVRKFGYYLEERKFVMTMSFQDAKKKK